MWNRRQFLGTAAAGALGALGSTRRSLGAPTGVQAPSASGTSPDFTAAFLTDPHVFERLGAERGAAMAVRHAMAQPRPPELMLLGGDLAFDILETDRKRADDQYALFDAGLEGLKLPIHYTIGNHDCLGVYESSGMSPGDKLYGKEYFQRRYKLERPYHSFDHEDWHFAVLDTIGIVERGYRGWVDAEQIAWLDDDLAASGKPTVIIGHVPLFSNYMEWNRGTSQGIPSGVSVVNAHEVAPVLVKHPVKLVLAGHLHVVESYQYKGIEFANLGAVSGNWWKGERDGFQEGYSLLEFRGDQVSWRYVDYGWEVPQEAQADSDPAA